MICRGCFAEIHFIRMESGKMMPCDWEIQYGDGKVTLVTHDGKMTVKAGAEVQGYVPHFATCPKRAVFQRAKSMKGGSK